MKLELTLQEAMLLRVLLQSAGMVVVGAGLTAHEVGIPIFHDEAKCTREVMRLAPDLLDKVQALIDAEKRGGN